MHDKQHMNATCQIKSLQRISTLVHVALIVMFVSQSPKYLQKKLFLEIVQVYNM
jgi:hypothetical protein